MYHIKHRCTWIHTYNIFCPQEPVSSTLGTLSAVLRMGELQKPGFTFCFYQFLSLKVSPSCSSPAIGSKCIHPRGLLAHNKQSRNASYTHSDYYLYSYMLSHVVSSFVHVCNYYKYANIIILIWLVVLQMITVVGCSAWGHAKSNIGWTWGLSPGALVQYSQMHLAACGGIRQCCVKRPK